MRKINSGLKKIVYSVEDVATIFGIARSSAYNYVKSGEIPSFRMGERILITKSSIQKILLGANNPGSPIPYSGNQSYIQSTEISINDMDEFLENLAIWEEKDKNEGTIGSERI